MSNESYVVMNRQPSRSDQAKKRGFHLAEAFFRRWPLFILPVVLLPVVGFVQAKKTVADFKSTGVMDVVNNPLLGDLGHLQPSGSSNQESPAAATARTVIELLGTDGFVGQVVDRAGLKTALANGEISALDIRRHVSATESGYQLVKIAATWPSGHTAQQLSQATIDAYVDYVVASQVSKTKDASAFWAQRVSAYEQKLQAAQHELKQYIADKPAPDIGNRPDAQTFDMKALSDAIDQAQAQVTKAETERENADLSTQQLTTAANQALQVVDKPDLPAAPESIRKKQALTIAIFFVLGVILSGALLIVSTFLDRTVQSAEDVGLSTGLLVVATVPLIRSLTRVKRRAARPDRRTRAVQS
jgi:uncharacterized protein involved in exopolysaccharide biosynthesis